MSPILQSRSLFQDDYLKDEPRIANCDKASQKTVSKTKGIMESQHNPNEPGKPGGPGQQGQDKDRERQECERQQREREKQGGGGQQGAHQQGGHQQGGR